MILGLVDRCGRLGDGTSSSRSNSAACRERGEPDCFVPYSESLSDSRQTQPGRIEAGSFGASAGWKFWSTGIQAGSLCQGSDGSSVDFELFGQVVDRETSCVSFEEFGSIRGIQTGLRSSRISDLGAPPSRSLKGLDGILTLEGATESPGDQSLRSLAGV